MRIAEEEGFQSLAFSAISTGVYGYPVEEATDIAVSTVLQTLSDLKTIKKVIFVVFDRKTETIYEEVFKHYQI